MPSHITQVFRTVREALGSQSEVGEHLGVTQAAVSAWETGRRGPPNRVRLYALAGLAFARGRPDLAQRLLAAITLLD